MSDSAVPAAATDAEPAVAGCWLLLPQGLLVLLSLLSSGFSSSTLHVDFHLGTLKS